MAEKTGLYDPDKDFEVSARERPTRSSGIRFKKERQPIDTIIDHISAFRRQKLRAGILKENDGNFYFNPDLINGADDNLSEDMYESRMKKLIEKVCGNQYLKFLESGSPLARFWVQLKIGIEVIPKSEYMYYLQSVLDMPVAEMETFGTSKMKDVFMKKFGFLSDEEVEEYLEIIINECDVENVIDGE